MQLRPSKETQAAARPARERQCVGSAVSGCLVMRTERNDVNDETREVRARKKKYRSSR